MHVGVFVVGVAFGSGFSMVTTLTVDCFGVKHFATNYGAVDLAPSLGSLTSGRVAWLEACTTPTQFPAADRAAMG